MSVGDTRRGISREAGAIDGVLASISDYNISYLIVAGGGGGGKSLGGGGGGGGVLYNAAYNISRGLLYSVIVGAGGAQEVNGSPSSFNGIATVGGGRGAGHPDTPWTPALVGGSGGGGAVQESGAGTPGEHNKNGAAGTVGQGNSGGTGIGTFGGDFAGGGGGGASAVGVNGGAFGDGGAGGAGLANSITGVSTSYGGGGGGVGSDSAGAGGSGGGGLGGLHGSTQGSNAVASTGGGGGGGSSNGGSGGSGCVILRIPVASYTGVTTGSPIVTTDGAFKVLKFTANGSYTA